MGLHSSVTGDHSKGYGHLLAQFRLLCLDLGLRNFYGLFSFFFLPGVFGWRGNMNVGSKLFAFF